MRLEAQMPILFGSGLLPNPSLRTTRKTHPLPQRDDGQRRLICAAGARGRRHWCAATRARSRHDRGGVRGRLTRCRRSRRRSAARTDSRPTAVDKRVLSSTARDTVITFVVLEHHVVACTSPPSGRTSNGRSLRCRRTVDVNTVHRQSFTARIRRTRRSTTCGAGRVCLGTRREMQRGAAHVF